MLMHFDQNGVGVAVHVDCFNVLRVARSLTFEPEAIARAAVIVHLTGAQSFLPGVPVHIGEH